MLFSHFYPAGYQPKGLCVNDCRAQNISNAVLESLARFFPSPRAKDTEEAVEMTMSPEFPWGQDSALVLGVGLG